MYERYYDNWSERVEALKARRTAMNKHNWGETCDIMAYTRLYHQSVYVYDHKVMKWYFHTVPPGEQAKAIIPIRYNGVDHYDTYDDVHNSWVQDAEASANTATHTVELIRSEAEEPEYVAADSYGDSSLHIPPSEAEVMESCSTPPKNLATNITSCNH